MADCKNRIMALCSRREYCEKDIREKLHNEEAKGNITAAEAGEFLQLLIKERFIDNSRYAAAFVRDKSQILGWGRDKISFYLKNKGIDNETIASALDYCNDPKAEKKMETIIRRKWDSLKSEEDYSRVEKTMKYALGRGYRYDEIKKIIHSFKD